MRSTPPPEPVPPEITSEVAPISVSPGQQTHTTDQKIDITIPPQSSPVDPVICSAPRPAHPARCHLGGAYCFPKGFSRLPNVHLPSGQLFEWIWAVTPSCGLHKFYSAGFMNVPRENDIDMTQDFGVAVIILAMTMPKQHDVGMWGLRISKGHLRIIYCNALNLIFMSPGSTAAANWSTQTLTAAASTPAPKFQTPPQRWRGLTIEAAQWFQTIVSRAIKQSVEASSIRLLRAEISRADIPEEVHRLEMQRTGVETKYKTLVRKRWQLTGALDGHLDDPEFCDPMTAARTVEELFEVSVALDQLTDVLHTVVVVEQLGQLKSLCDVHFASALAMALRKAKANGSSSIHEVRTTPELDC
ncbi:hypothetical protein DEU56DRAFT_915132 [Suillus clintonianus]|uniref:uncharacterized protein n=1 Tax=Suillus clintonianus TaxID=1904413 RepID=UPI001B85D320|nr:uncharacterized protein DEU56DRAFT_915132 [Suillus clintonianus]KAG2129628.1 hypothetical protein DEU56DRAFT_915132 [Suillus clintonianus]